VLKGNLYEEEGMEHKYATFIKKTSKCYVLYLVQRPYEDQILRYVMLTAALACEICTELENVCF
jgi:hypothetical protein